MANAGAIRAGSAFVELFADDSALQKGLASAEKSVKRFGLSVGKIGAAIGGLGAAITAPMIAAANTFANAGSALNDMSERTGVSVQSLSALGFAAEQTGTNMETVEGGIRKMQRALTAGSEENQAAVGTFNALGLSIQKLMALNPGDQFQAIAQRIAGIRNPTAQAGAALQIFGKSGTALLPMIKDLRALTQEAKNFNLIWTPEEAKAADALGDSISLLNQVIKKNIALVGGALAPSFTRWNVAMANLSKQIGQFIKANQSLIVTISTVGFALVAAGTAIVALGTVIFGMGQIIGVVSGAISVLYSVVTFLLSPLGLVLIAVAGLTTAFLLFTETGQKMAAFFKVAFGDMLATGIQTFKGIADAMKAGDIELAAKILWAGLKVIWLQGTGDLISAWDDLKSKSNDVFSTIKFNLASHMLDAWAAIQDGAVRASFVVSDIWESATTNIPIGFKVMTNAIKDLWGGLISALPGPLVKFFGLLYDKFSEIKGLVTGSFLDTKKFGKELMQASEGFKQATSPEALAKQKGERDAELAKMQDDRDKAAAKKAAEKQQALDQIEAERKGAQAALLSGEDIEAENRRKQDQAKIDAAKKELADAKAQLGGLAGKAAGAAERASAKSLVDAAFGRDEDAKDAEEPMTPDGLDKGLKEAASKVDVSGTFSSAAAAGLGIGSTIDKEHLNESKKQTGELEKIRKNTAKQQVFSD